MDVFKLNSTFYPVDTVKLNLDSDTLIWTERYQQNGEFQIVVKDDIRILTALPVGSLISHTETLQVMIVEDHAIKRNSDKTLEVAVTGRSFEAFTENRVTWGTRVGLYDATTGASNIQVITDEAEDAIVTLLTAAFVAPTTPATEDAVANLTVHKTIRVMDPVFAHTIPRGLVSSAIEGLMKLSQSGLKSIRPNGALTTLDLMVHDGVDRTTTVIFRAADDDLENAEYFWSIRGYKNYAQVATHITARQHRHRDIPAPLLGLERRYMYVEANDLEGTYSPPTASDEIAARGQSELDANRQVTLIGATIAITAKPKFKIHYDIGDLVTVNGEFSTSSIFQVTEHILTMDNDGIRGYPTLSIL